MSVKFSNNGKTTLSAGISASDTSVPVTDASVLPAITGSEYFYMSLEDTSGNIEIVKVTGVSSNTLTVTRAQESTTARAFTSGDKAENRLTAAGLNDVATQADTDTTYTAGSGLSLTGTEFANTAPDQTVALTGAGATSISGTYPNFTITSTDTNTDTDTTYTAGSGLSLTGTEFANTAPDQTVTLTGAGTTTVSGTYPNFTITGAGTTYTAGTGITLTGTEFSLTDASDYMKEFGSTTADLDTLTASGVYRIGNTNANRPADWGQLLTAYAGAADTIGQIYFDYSDGNIKTRAGNPSDVGGSGSWSAWRTVWTDENDGSGSGLDADTVDGIQASSFLRSDASDSFTGTLTGGALHAGGEITNSSAKLQVNGFQRTGTIYLHEGTSAVAGNNWALETTSGAELRWNTNKIWHAGNDGSGSGLDADTVDGVEASGFGRFYNNAVLNSSTTTANLISELQNDYGAFNNNYVTLKCSWSYANNSDLVTGHSTIGTIELAGCLVEAWGGTYKHIRITRPTTGTGGSTICVYNDQGSSYSPAWREIWTSESDGAGSGLDADTVDGIDSSRIIFGQNSTGTTRTNPSQTLKSGFYDEYQTNTPTSTWYSYINIRHDNTGNNYGHQIAGSFYDLNLWNRNINNNSFGSWTKSWSSANDGSGSGLDADLLDGVQGGSYLRSDATDYVNGVLYLRADIRNEDAYRDHSCMGHYNSYKTNQIWSMGSSYRSHASGTNFGNLYGAAYKHTNNSTGGHMAHGHQFVWCQNGTGYAALGTNIWTSGNVTAYSDIRVKKNIERIPNALDKVCRLNGYTFERTDVKFDNEGEPTVPVKQTGVIAQEVLEVLPEAVTGDEENHYSVAYGNMVGLLIESIKELKAEVDDLKAQLEQNQ